MNFLSQITCLFALGLVIMRPADTNARTLFYGNASVELTDVQKTFPALHVKISDTETQYGALYTTAAPTNSLHIGYNSTDYWVGQWCEPGQYLAPESRDCDDCGFGHYCTGGTAREVCSGGAIACGGRTESQNAVADDDLLNRFLTEEESKEYLPVTQVADWESVHCCTTYVASKYNGELRYDLSLMHNEDIGGCPVQVAGPGTYLFFEQNKAADACCKTTQYCSEENFYGAGAIVMVFDHAVSFKIIHANGVFGIFVDTQSTEFKSHDFWSPHTGNAQYCDVGNRANISDFMNMVHTGDTDKKTMCVYKLK